MASPRALRNRVRQLERGVPSQSARLALLSDEQLHDEFADAIEAEGVHDVAAALRRLGRPQFSSQEQRKCDQDLFDTWVAETFPAAHGRSTRDD